MSAVDSSGVNHVGHRRVRSFVRREGRLTPGQQRAIDALWPLYGIEPDAGLLDLGALFGRRAPRILEIGFGNGEALADLAARHPENDYLGVEVHRPGVGRLLMELERRQITNVRVACTDAVELLEGHLPPASLDALYLFFPDPWPKKRHHKRRIVQPVFAQTVRGRLKVGGRWHLATDWEDYAGHMVAVLDAAEGFRNLAADDSPFVPRPAFRPLTKFEQRGQRLGHGVWDLVYERTG